jgi:hypothetical protein
MAIFARAVYRDAEVIPERAQPSDVDINTSPLMLGASNANKIIGVNLLNRVSGP